MWVVVIILSPSVLEQVPPCPGAREPPWEAMGLPRGRAFLNCTLHSGPETRHLEGRNAMTVVFTGGEEDGDVCLALSANSGLGRSFPSQKCKVRWDFSGASSEPRAEFLVTRRSPPCYLCLWFSPEWRKVPPKLQSWELIPLLSPSDSHLYLLPGWRLGVGGGSKAPWPPLHWAQ